MNSYIYGAIGVVFLILVAVAGTFYFKSKNLQTDLDKVNVELSTARENIKTQSDTIEKMQKDAQKQADLYKQYQLTVDDIRAQTVKDLSDISNTDYVKEANTDAQALEKTINDRTAKTLNSINEVTQGK